jgi:4-hydroxy-tetrahydrodipicolinate synthase
LIDEGADFLSTTAPLAFCPSQDAIVRHFEILTQRTGARWMVYGNAFSYPEILPETFRRLSEIDGIAAIKDTRPDYQGALKNLMAVENKNVAYLSGGEYLIGAMFLMGARGNISGLSSLFPGPFVRLYAAAAAKDVKRVAALSREIAGLHVKLSALGFWLAAFKAAGARMGLMQPWCADPTAMLTDPEAIRQIDQLIDQYTHSP